jgi:ABC-2 type transport system ATP-binding protein
MKKILEIKQVDFSYGNVKALDDVSLSMGEGIFGLLGPNGAGKTTLMKVLLGFLVPHKGFGEVMGYDIRNQSMEMKRKIGYMPESDCLIPGMDAVLLTSYLGQLSGMPRQEAMKRAHEVLYYVGLEESRYRMVDTYSSGMKQRLKLAAAIVHDPDILFLDEPTSGMDPQARKEMLDLIGDISAKGSMNMIISSHILSDIESTCSRVVIMDQGKIVAEQEVAGIKQNRFNIFDLKLKGDIQSFQKKFPNFKIETLDRGGYRLHTPTDFSREALFKAAWESGIQIRHFKQSRATLEEVFLTAIGENHAH